MNLSPIEASPMLGHGCENASAGVLSAQSHKPGTKRERLLEALKGSWLTPLEAAQKYGVFALSQRVGEFKREGWSVLDQWVETKEGARVKAYFITGKA